MSLLNIKHDSQDSSPDSAASGSTEDLLKILSKSDVILEDSLSASDLSLDATSDLLSSLKDVHTNRYVTKRTPRNRSISGPGKRGTRSQKNLEYGARKPLSTPPFSNPFTEKADVKNSFGMFHVLTENKFSCSSWFPTTTEKAHDCIQTLGIYDEHKIKFARLCTLLGFFFNRSTKAVSWLNQVDFRIIKAFPPDPNLLDGSSKNSDQSAIATKVEELTPWERWLLQKEKIRRQELKRLRQKEAHLRAKQAQAAASQAEKQQRSLVKCKEWLESKHRLLKEQNEAAAMARKEQLMKEQFKRESKKLESERKYALWCEQKKLEAKETAELIRQKEILAAASAQRRREAAVAKFVDWMKSAQQRKLNPPVSYGYADGTVIYFEVCILKKPMTVQLLQEMKIPDVSTEECKLRQRETD
ncbi:CCDC34 protein Fragment [Clonorchis sinensis]|uniref:CCDC34 protein n=1 Tax=Clonorchis sinensis TaxID=79923 RepID=G7YEA1_CLOSI|nr:CCDC34 protein Fragment [Clonorchis sinensis]